MTMPVLFKRNSLSSMGGGGGGGGGEDRQTDQPNRGCGGMPYGMKRPPPPTERELVLASRSKTQGVTLKERSRRQEIEMKNEAAAKIQRAWKRYVRNKKGISSKTLADISRDNIRKKRLNATQEEWERQIAALTIQFAWRKYFRKKLMATLHPNRRQLQLWDPEIVALKQQALLHYIYNEQLIAPFWHPIPKAMARPLWTRFIPSAAAVSYNFAVDQYVPWVARLGGIPPLPEDEGGEEDSGRNPPRHHPSYPRGLTPSPLSRSSQNSASSVSRHNDSQSQALSSERSDRRGNRASNTKSNKRSGQRPRTTLVTTKRTSGSSQGIRVKS